MTGVPDVMRVARLHAWDDVRIEREPVPRPGRGEILVRIEACGVCGSDALEWYVARKAPVVLGHEPAGTVVLAGEDVTSVEVGDRVFVHHHAPCNQCEECRRGLWSNCALWRGTRLEPGGFAEYARVPAPNVVTDTLVLPPHMGMDTATFVEPVACCLRTVRRAGGTAQGDVVAIIGLGAMGLVMAQLARLEGAALVIGSDYLPERRDLARRLGFDLRLDDRPDAEIIAAILDPTVITKILSHLGLSARAPPRSPARH
ncbi:MAG: alcohol dehydrogenase catalytic domain-containing protein, partial [Gemmatimonadetes bacterium]|nr:alcohol dehydrogenase catalytic domain-containing protein [Gemmatimonadota bacterium]